MEESVDQQGLLEKPVELQLLHTEHPKQFLGGDSTEWLWTQSSEKPGEPPPGDTLCASWF